MKCIKILLLLLVMCELLCSCELLFEQNKKVSNSEVMGFNLPDYQIVEEDDNYGFRGEGSKYLILDCSSNSNKAREIVKGWVPLPLSDNLQLIMFGGQKGVVNYSYELAKEAHLPEVKNGFYKFINHKGFGSLDDSLLLLENSFNFELAVYDSDTDTLYYFSYDT